MKLEDQKQYYVYGQQNNQNQINGIGIEISQDHNTFIGQFKDS